MIEFPIIFQRHPTNRVTGVAEYAAIVSILTLIISVMLAAALHGTLVAMGGNADIAGYSMFVLLPIVGIALTVFAFKDYRRRADVRVVVDVDSIQVRQNQKERSALYEDISDARIIPMWFDEACELKLIDQTCIRLPLVIASASMVREPFEQSLIPVLAVRVAGEIGAGGDITINDDPLRAWARLPWGVCLAAGDPVVCQHSVYRPWSWACRCGSPPIPHGLPRNP